MSTFIWGKIKLKTLPKDFNSYQQGDILVFFDTQKNDLYMTDLGDREIYFNIACGYQKMIYPYEHRMNYLNCSEQYFSLQVPKEHRKNISLFYNDLYTKLKNLQNVISDLLNRPEIEKIEYYHTDTGNEYSIDEYKQVCWKIDDFANNLFQSIKNNHGFTPTIKVLFLK